MHYADKGFARHPTLVHRQEWALPCPYVMSLSLSILFLLLWYANLSYGMGIRE